MEKFTDFLLEEFKDKEFEKEFYKGLEKARIAIEIAFFRDKRGLTQIELAKLVNTSQSAIARLENTDYKRHSINTLRRIAEALDLELVITFREKEVNVSENLIILDSYYIKYSEETNKYKYFKQNEIIDSENIVNINIA
jgi:transcriptional regulator with XRE-family HTH domain